MAKGSASILVVDDEAMIRHALSDLLGTHGFSCATACDARAALQVLQARPCDLVLADVNMPGEDGLWLLQKVREGYPDTAVVMLTGVGDVRVAVAALKLGAYDYITKPFKIEDVVGALHSTLDRRRLRLENERYQRSLEEMVESRTSELNLALEDVEVSYNATLEALSAALDARERETQDHSQRVQAYTLGVARAYGIPSSRLGDIGRGALLHDIGKIGVSDNILLKPARLTPEEWVEMRRHPETGYQILRNIPYFEGAARIVRYHHERWDGRGYPYGLRGDEIPIEARLFMIADTVDAMTSDRVYRKALSMDAAIAELERYAGSQFDPRVVACFVENVDTIVGAVRPHLLTGSAALV